MQTTINNIINLISSVNGIGIFISGGFDSAVLSAIIFENVSQNQNVKITLFTVPRHDDSAIHSDRVIKWLNNRYPSVSFNRKLVGNPDVHHSIQVSSGFSEAFALPEVEIIILADTANPTIMQESSAPNRIKAKNPKIHQPFFYSDKTMTLSIALHMNLLSEISSISHTCTERKTLKCNECWQCRERAWAFKELNLIDNGTM